MITLKHTKQKVVIHLQNLKFNFLYHIGIRSEPLLSLVSGNMSKCFLFKGYPSNTQHRYNIENVGTRLIANIAVSMSFQYCHGRAMVEFQYCGSILIRCCYLIPGIWGSLKTLGLPGGSVVESSGSINSLSWSDEGIVVLMLTICI